MEEFKIKALSSASPPHLWLRYIDDTFAIQQAKQSHQLLWHINSQYPHIQFTMEDSIEDGTLPFLDTPVSPGSNNLLTATVYRKPTHKEQNLHWESNHFTSAKNSMLTPWHTGQGWSFQIN